MKVVSEGFGGILFLLAVSIPIFQWSQDCREEAGVDRRRGIRRNNSGDGCCDWNLVKESERKATVMAPSSPSMCPHPAF